MTLPRCSIQYPSCGACGDDTSFDGESIVCDPCGLNYGTGEDDTEAEYLDYDDATPCAEPCANRWHEPGRIRDGFEYACQPCALPSGHTSDHWTTCTIHKIEGTPTT